jgi:hypothetical protein
MTGVVLTDEQIEQAKGRTNYTTGEPLHQHNDCIRIAYEWLDAQIKTVSPTKRGFALKHLIEKWGGRYVSQSDVEVAAQMHPKVKGKYPYYNISARLVLPAEERLRGIGEAFTHSNYREQQTAEKYTYKEGSK